MSKLPIFTTERRILREVTEEDGPAYEKNFVDHHPVASGGEISDKHQETGFFGLTG